MTDAEATAWDAMLAVFEIAESDRVFAARFQTTIEAARDAIERASGNFQCDQHCGEYFPPEDLRIVGEDYAKRERVLSCQGCFPTEAETPHGPASWDDMERLPEDEEHALNSEYAASLTTLRPLMADLDSQERTPC